MSDSQRRRIDLIQSPEFLSGLEAIPIDELRLRRRTCADLDVELSFYRRLLQGRLDLLAFELRRRAGEEERSLIEALPDILAAWTSPGPAPSGRRVAVEIPDLPARGRRSVDRALSDDFLLHLSELSDADLRDVQARLIDAEAEVSRQRRAVFEASDRIEQEFIRRYRLGSAGGSLSPGRG